MSSIVKAIILDVDGVIIGEKVGYNSPYPNERVTEKLKKISNSGIPIILCTAKPHFAIKKVIQDANLNNFHITDGGGVVIDPSQNIVLSKHIIPTGVVKKIIDKLLSLNVYTEIYTVDNYFIQASQAGEITTKHQQVIQSLPIQVESFNGLLNQLEVTKIMPIANNLEDKERVNSILQQFVPEVTTSWGVHPVILPLQFGIITAPGISKAIAASEILKYIGVNAKDTLGVGDSTSDWQFIDPCGYGVAMGNATEELKKLVISKGKEKYFIAPTVDNNGILAAFTYFDLI